MSEYFNGWRRKAGVVTLVMACALMYLWVRSQAHYDEIAFSTTLVGGYGQELQSMNGCLTWSRRSRPMKDVFEYDSDFLSTTSAVGFGDGLEDAGQSWFVPYLAIAIPMTLLSGSLILWKPRDRPTQTGSALEISD